jgi:hypothetical protein
MNRFSGILKVALALAVVVALGVAIGWWSSGGRKASPKPGGNGVEPVTPGETQPVSSPVVPPVTSASATNTAAMVEIPATSPSVVTNWEDKLDEILGGDDDESQKARQMAALLPSLPEDGQVEVAQHLSNLVSDEEYSMISGFVTNAALPEAVLDVLIADSLNRPNSVKLPLLLDVAREPQNPKATEAREILELFLEEDYGDDWAKWQAKMQEWIANNPD